jgi:hypothetical protein
MKNKKSIYKIPGILILLVFILGFTLVGCKTQNKTAGATITPQTETTTATKTTVAETQSTEQLSEQPDKAKYDEYFSEYYLAKIPLGTEMSQSNLPVKTAVFITSEDQFGSNMSLKKDIPAGSLSGAVYDTVAKKDFEPKTAFPMALKASNYAGFGPLKYPPGKYEYKVYVDDVLVVVIPFEVR